MAENSTTESGGGNGIVDKVRQRAAEQLSSQKDRAFEGIGSVAQAVRQSTHQLRDQHHETLAGYVEQAADQIDRFAKQLQDKDLTELLDDAQRLARRQPAMFVGSAFALGLVGARFLKSSTRHSDGGRHQPDDRYRNRRDERLAYQTPAAPQYGGPTTVGSQGNTVASGLSSPGSGSTPLASGSAYGSGSGGNLTSASAGTATGGGPASGISAGSPSGSTRTRQGVKTDSPATPQSRPRRPDQA